MCIVQTRIKKQTFLAQHLDFTFIPINFVLLKAFTQNLLQIFVINCGNKKLKL